jgi:hypothetical protein
MLNINNYRRDGNQPERATSSFPATFGRTIENMVVYELGYGGKILRFSETEIELQTEMFGGVVDRTKISGSADEMRLLYQIARYHSEILNSEQARNRIVDAAVNATGEEVSTRLLAITAGNTLGEIATKVAIFMAMNLSEEQVRKFAAIRLKDIVACFQLHLESGDDLIEILDATTP